MVLTYLHFRILKFPLTEYPPFLGPTPAKAARIDEDPAEAAFSPTSTWKAFRETLRLEKPQRHHPVDVQQNLKYMEIINRCICNIYII